MTNPSEVMTISETAQYLRVSLSSLYKLAQEGRVPCKKVGKHWRFHRGALERWLQFSNNATELEIITQELESPR